MLRPALVALCAATIATGAMAQSTGVAVCDDFLKKYEICINTKIPANQRAQHKGVLDNIRSTFAAAKSSGMKSANEPSCDQMAEQYKALLRRVGCTF